MGTWANQDYLSAASDRGLGLGPMPSFRSDLDAVRSQWNTQAVSYPDGYLGTIESTRRSQRIKSGRNLFDVRNYDRGVHHGSRVDPNSYVWPAEFNPATSIELEARGQRFAPLGLPTMVTDPTTQARGMVVPDPDRRRQLAELLPAWT